MNYWTIIDNRHAGPFTAEQLMERGLSPDTPVWHPGLPDWVEAREIPELCSMIESARTAPAPEPPAEPEPQPYAGKPAPQPYAGKPEPQPYAGQPEPQPYGGFAPAQQPWRNDAPRRPWQAEPPMQPAPQCPPAYLAWSIIVTILCCQVLGVIAIVCSAQVKSAYNRGEYQRAQKLSEWAQWMIILAIVIGLLAMPLQLLLL